MTERNKHLFQFPAQKIAKAAEAEATYHTERAVHWENVMRLAQVRVQETASVKVDRQQVTGGWRPEVIVNYGDPAAYTRMSEAAIKMQWHVAAGERFSSDALLYNTQGDRIYELDADDVAHFRLNGRPREE